MALPGMSLSNQRLVIDNKTGKMYLLVKGLSGAKIGYIELTEGEPKHIIEQRKETEKRQAKQAAIDKKQKEYEEQLSKELQKSRDEVLKKYEKDVAPGVIDKVKRVVFGEPVIIDDGELIGSVDYAGAEERVREEQKKSVDELMKEQAAAQRKVKMIEDKLKKDKKGEE